MSAISKTFILANTSFLKYLNNLRYSSFNSSPKIDDVQVTAKYEITRDPNEWKYVERVLPPTIVPTPTIKEHYASNWQPQSENLKDRLYFIQRTKNHLLPVYLKVLQRGIRKLTYVKKVQGDIWLLGNELETFLQPLSKTPLRMQINEFAGFICINGDYVNAVKHYLLKKNY